MKGLAGAEESFKRREWCNKNVGEQLADWDFFPASNTFVFAREDDAILFRLMFE